MMFKADAAIKKMSVLHLAGLAGTSGLFANSVEEA